MASQSRVNIQHLSDFGQKTAGFGIKGGDHDTMSDFTKAMGDPGGKIMKGTVAGASLGTSEAKEFQYYYQQAITEPLKSFMQDVPKAFMALGGGAVVEAANYYDGDQNQAQAMDDVIKMFTADPSKGLDADLARKQNEDESKKVKVQELPPPDTKDDKAVSKDDGTTSADRRATDLYNKYKNDMSWPSGKLPDPNTKILAPGPNWEYPDSSSSGDHNTV